MNFELKNGLLNLPSLQLKMDNIVFDHIDTKPNWSKAYEQLDEILQKMAVNFNISKEQKEGALPKASTYWVPFMDITAKLLYFTGLAHSHLIDAGDEETKAHIVNLYRLSTACLPNAQIEENEEFLTEVKKSIVAIAPQTEQPVEITTSNSVDECIAKFETFANTYK